METKINYEVAREILTSYMGLLSQEILKEEAKASANMRKKSVLENEQRRAMETLKNLTEDDTDTIEHILYVYGTLLMTQNSYKRCMKRQKIFTKLDNKAFYCVYPYNF